MVRKGWHNESRRHALASKGIKTAQKIPSIIRDRPIKGSFSNRELKSDMALIVQTNREFKEKGGQIVVMREYEKGFSKPFGLAIGNYVYWYSSEDERDSDLKLMEKLLL